MERYERLVMQYQRQKKAYNSMYPNSSKIQIIMQKVEEGLEALRLAILDYDDKRILESFLVVRIFLDGLKLAYREYKSK